MLQKHKPNIKQKKLETKIMATIKRFEDIEIWQEARKLSKEIIKISKDSDLKSDFRLKDQIKVEDKEILRRNYLIMGTLNAIIQSF